MKGLNGKIIIIIVILNVACGVGKKERLAEIQEVPISYTSVDIRLPVSQLEKAINRLIGDQLYNGGFPINKKRDSLFLNIRRIRPLTLTYKNGKLSVSAPIEVKTAIKKKILGMTVSNRDSPLLFEATASLSSTIALDGYWNPELDCKWGGLEWEEAPVFSLFGLKLDLSEFIEIQLDNNKAVIEDVLCELLTTQINTQKILTKVYKSTQQPVRVLMDPMELYLTSQPTTIRGNLVANSPLDTIVLHLEQQSFISISPSKALVDAVVKLPGREDVLNDETVLSTFIELRMPLVLLESTMYELLKREEFVYEGFKGKVKEIAISAEEGRLKLEIALTGDLEGNVVVFAVPHIDDQMVFGLSSLEYELVKMEKWAKITDFAVHQAVESYIIEKAMFDLKPFLVDLDGHIAAGVSKSQVGGKIDLDLNLYNFKQFSKGLSKDEIQFILQMNGGAEITLKENAFITK